MIYVIIIIIEMRYKIWGRLDKLSLSLNHEFDQLVISKGVISLIFGFNRLLWFNVTELKTLWSVLNINVHD